jgi:hypothetical protein
MSSSREMLLSVLVANFLDTYEFVIFIETQTKLAKHTIVRKKAPQRIGRKFNISAIPAFRQDVFCLALVIIEVIIRGDMQGKYNLLFIGHSRDYSVFSSG